MTSLARQVTLAAALVLFAVALAAPSFCGPAGKAVDPCALLTKADIQEAFGQPVEAGKAKPGATPAAGASCSFAVPPYGSFDLLVKPLGASETPDRILAAFQKSRSRVEVVPGLGDKSFFVFPGYGMVQLNTIKGSTYILFTIMIPGGSEPAVKAAAEKLMRRVLPKV